MAGSKATRRGGRSNPIREIETAGVQIVAHHALNAVELTVVDEAGRGYRTWFGADAAPTVALRFFGAVMRLIAVEVT
jgi:hypothetical protein